MKRSRLLLSLLSLFITGTACAALTSGYYYVKSYNGKYLTENKSSQTLICSDLITPTNYSQVWYIDATTGTLLNMLTSHYIQGQGTFSQQYTTGTAEQRFTIAENGGIVTFQWDSYYKAGLHCDNSNVVVEWYIDEDKSKWTIEAVTVDWDEVQAQRAALSEVSTDQLTTFFTTTACTELKSHYASMSDDDLRSAMSALPTTVQDMAVKVKNDTWTTYDGWDKTEKTFRVADYSAYSSGDRWTGILGLGHHFGRLTNPTGITVSTGDHIQVYVGDIPSGQSVRLEVAGEYQAAGATYALKQGMNVLLMVSGGNCFVQYEVDNTTNGGAPYTALSNYDDVTVHIEGGTVNGYFDLTKGDTNSDWVTLQSHLLTGTCVELKTGNLLFHMHTDLVKAACPSKMVEMLGEWDKILDMEYSLMGLDEFDGYWNNLLSATDMTGESYMHATTYGTFYNVTTVPEVMNYDNLFAGGALWGPAHENGHIFQKYINMVGQTEVSNNVFSNVAVYNNGHLTSRASNISTTFANMANNVYWNERDIWERTHLYFQLYQFFHILGKSPDFYPNLFKALRSDPMIHTGGAFISASDDYLKFYKKCCEVSGYDLTEFFQAYGFFIVPTLTSYTLNNVTKDAFLVADYSNYYLTVTQSEIDAAKQAVANMNLPKCNIIFIEDRITAPLATYEGHAEGELKKAFNNESLIGIGETGQYTDFGVTPSAYTFNVSERGNVTVSGTGAVGFKLYDASGNLVGVYNTTTFSLPAAAFDENGLKSGYTLQAAAGDGTMATATYDASIEVNEFPKINTPYTFCTPYRGGRFVTSTGAAAGMNGQSITTPTDAMKWQFVQRSGEAETFDIQNIDDKSYIDPSATGNTQLYTVTTKPAKGWKVKAIAETGLYIIYTTDGCQIHQANSGDYNIINWGGGGNTTDTGCQFAIEEVTEISSTALDELAGLGIIVSTSAANDLTTGQWYVMFNRGRKGYLYEETTHTLDNTSTVPSDACPYLVRLIEASNGKYYLQTGYGNYFWRFQHGTRVSTTPQKSEPVTISKIGGTDGHFYLQNVNSNIVLDSNNPGEGVVGYGSTVPSSTDGNNDWAFYPVTFTCPVKLNASGYATFAGNYAADYTDDSSFSAWMVKSVSGEEIVFQQIKEVAAPGTGVLLMGEPSSSVSVPLTNQNDGTDFSNENLLVGITSPTLIASDTYYGLSGNNFVRVNAGTVPARKALLQASVVDGAKPVKALTFVFNSEDGIETMGNGKWTMDNVQIYNLAGQRLSKPQRGINIINGKKVLVK